MVVSLIVGLVAQIIVAGLIKGALDTADGKPVSVGGMFEGWDKGKVLIAAIIVSVATAIGTLLCYLPGLIVGFLMSYTIFFVVDRNMEPMDAIKASISFTTGQPRTDDRLLPAGHPGRDRRRHPVRCRTAGRRPDRGARRGVHLPSAPGPAGHAGLRRRSRAVVAHARLEIDRPARAWVTAD